MASAFRDFSTTQEIDEWSSAASRSSRRSIVNACFVLRGLNPPSSPSAVAYTGLSSIPLNLWASFFMELCGLLISTSPTDPRQYVQRVMDDIAYGRPNMFYDKVNRTIGKDVVYLKSRDTMYFVNLDLVQRRPRTLGAFPSPLPQPSSILFPQPFLSILATHEPFLLSSIVINMDTDLRRLTDDDIRRWLQPLQPYQFFRLEDLMNQVDRVKYNLANLLYQHRGLYLHPRYMLSVLGLHLFDLGLDPMFYTTTSTRTDPAGLLHNFLYDVALLFVNTDDVL
ncbi:hypothetical protein AK812_SmicGene37397 [Symbiodinium microadriaticum]|uniref:Uncharacterized protein n=1 Tax=Symbiodinium microadriaticum TaxID=2951 RepID=A0A1Q9CGC7_SYMMI|nr:hypothetical protein AK812_SmicGene37397 [Symbiodinium microadriaticum]CAE7857049.1 unnamed protein product [Symbiodinium microadriaticum]CAE7913142.1 unnamed protein product [Symbiodinium sp. KB8]